MSGLSAKRRRDIENYAKRLRNSLDLAEQMDDKGMQVIAAENAAKFAQTLAREEREVFAKAMNTK